MERGIKKCVTFVICYIQNFRKNNTEALNCTFEKTQVLLG